MGRAALSLAFLFALAMSWAQTPGTSPDVQVAVERAIALGKGGDYAGGLALLSPYLEEPTPATAKACYVAGFLHKERFKVQSVQGDRAEAVRWLSTALDLDDRAGARAPWQESARQALTYLGGTYFDDAVRAVRTFEPGTESAVFALFDAHVDVARRLDPRVDDTAERAEFHKNLARAYRQWFETTGDEGHFEGIVDQYRWALEVRPSDVTATYNLAVNIYNRGVAVLKSMDENTTLPELFALQDACAAMFQRALPWFERANELQPDRPETLRGLMIVHHALNDNATSDAYRVQLENALKP